MQLGQDHCEVGLQEQGSARDQLHGEGIRNVGEQSWC